MKQLGKISMNAKCMGECMYGDSAGSNPRLGHTKLFLCFASPARVPFRILDKKKKEPRRANRWLFWRTFSSQYGRSEVISFSIILHSRRWYVEGARDENFYFSKPCGRPRACSPSEQRFQVSRTSRFSTFVMERDPTRLMSKCRRSHP